MKGILFKADMIQAAIEGRKTNTRRAEKALKQINENPDAYKYLGINTLSEHCFEFFLDDGTSTIKYIKSRYHAGETVYIKEAWATQHFYDVYPPSELPFRPKLFYKGDCSENRGRWRSPLHLPEWAARHFITITGVRAERLQHMSSYDAQCEGVFGGLLSFAELWNSINPKYRWESNPWVFPYTFRRVE